MRLTVNGEERSFPAGLSVAGLLETLEVDARRVVVERNREIVERGRLEEVLLKEGDRIEVVQFVGGG